MRQAFSQSSILSTASQPTRKYLHRLSVPDLPALTSPFDPGYAPLTVESHLDQSAHLISILKISMACWNHCLGDRHAVKGRGR